MSVDFKLNIGTRVLRWIALTKSRAGCGGSKVLSDDLPLAKFGDAVDEVSSRNCTVYLGNAVLCGRTTSDSKGLDVRIRRPWKFGMWK